MGLKLNTKVLGKEFEDDSPQCGEMSRSDRGDSLLLGGPFFKRVSLNNAHKAPIRILLFTYGIYR